MPHCQHYGLYWDKANHENQGRHLIIFFDVRPDEKCYLFPKCSKVSLLACQHSKSCIYVSDYVIKNVCNSSVPEM